MKHRLKQGYDFVLLVYPDGDLFDRRVHQLKSLFERAGLLMDTP